MCLHGFHGDAAVKAEHVVLGLADVNLVHDLLELVEGKCFVEAEAEFSWIHPRGLFYSRKTCLAGRAASAFYDVVYGGFEHVGFAVFCEAVQQLSVF